MNKPFFSVVIPLYNKEAYIGRTLDSVLAQSFGAYEVLVVNDGSSDGGAAVVRAYADRDARIRLLDKVNGGVSSARNHGINAAAGNYVAFVDADDWWEPNHLAELKALADAFPQAGMLGTAYARVFADGSSYAGIIAALKGGRGLVADYFNTVRQYQVVCASSIAIALPVLRGLSHLFPEQARHGEDLDLWTRVAIAHPVAFSGHITAAYDCSIPSQATRNTNFSAYGGYFARTIGSLVKRYPGNRALRAYGERIYFDSLGQFFRSRPFAREEFFAYVGRCEFHDWVRSRLFLLLCNHPHPVLWRFVSTLYCVKAKLLNKDVVILRRPAKTAAPAKAG